MAFKNIVVAIDYAHPTGAALKSMGQTLKAMFEPAQLARVKVVSIMNWGEYSFDGTPDAKIKKEILADVQKNLATAEKNLGLGVKAQLIEHKGRTTKSNVLELVKFLKKSKADLVVAATKNKKGLGAYFFGSFVEELSYQVPCALLAVHPETKAPKKKKPHYLLSHDLRENFSEGLDRIIKGMDKGDSMTIFHHFEMGLSKRTPEYVHELFNTKNERAHAIQSMFEKKGIDVDIIIDTDTGKTYEHILDCAAEVGATHIITTAQSEKLGAFFIGSTARKLLKTAKIPVLITHV